MGIVSASEHQTSLYERIVKHVQQQNMNFSISFGQVEIPNESVLYRSMTYSGEVDATLNGVTYSEFCGGDVRSAAQRVYERIAADLGITP